MLELLLRNAKRLFEHKHDFEAQVVALDFGRCWRKWLSTVYGRQSGGINRSDTRLAYKLAGNHFAGTIKSESQLGFAATTARLRRKYRMGLQLRVNFPLPCVCRV